MGAGSRGSPLHPRWLLLSANHTHQRRESPGGFHGRTPRYVADRELVHPEQMGYLQKFSRGAAEPGSRGPEPVVEERVPVADQLQAVRKEFKSGSRRAA